jgi:hypothetical protein
MPAPGDFIAKVSEKLATALIPLLHELWDRCERETKANIAASLMAPKSALETVARQLAEPPRAPQNVAEAVYKNVLIGALSPQKRGAQNRERKGVVKTAIREIIYSNPHGITRAGIRLAAHAMRGLTIKEGSLKQGLRLLSNAKEIENRDHLWFPTKNGGQSND